MVKLKAGTLVESLIAMVIIVVSLGVTTMIYMNVVQSDKQVLQMKGLFMINNEVKKIKLDKQYLDNERKVGDYLISSIIKEYNESENLYQISLTVKDLKGKTIASQNELIIIEE